MEKIDFRSDTMTQPTEAMRDAMRNAVLGDDVCEEDPTVNRLQQMAAQRLGMEAALFTPSGTFANQCAIAVHIKPSDEVIVQELTHVVEHETGATAALAGGQIRAFVPQSTTYPTVEDIRPRIRTGRDVHFPDTGLIVLENALTDGTVMPVEEMRRVRKLADEHGIPVHLDGARLFNAAEALGVDPKEITARVHSASVCLSKGLGAPVGSLLLGTNEFIEQARKRRKMMGGGMRQVGVLAAPGIVALQQGTAHLARDHANAALLARLLARIPGMVLDVDKVMTNMVFCHVDKPDRHNAGLVAFLAQKEILAYPPAPPGAPPGIRFMTHCNVSEDDVRTLAEAVSEYLAG